MGIGDAYVLPDAGAENRVKKWLRIRQVSIFIVQFVMIGCALQFRWNLVAVFLALIGIDTALWFGINSLAFRGLEVVSDRSNSVEEVGLTKLVGMLFVSLALVAAGIFIYPRGSWDQQVVGLGCIGFFGFGVVFTVGQMMKRLRAR